MSRFRIKGKSLHALAGVDLETWRAVLSQVEMLGGATERDFLGVCTLVAQLYSHPIECPRCHQSSWRLYGFVEPGSDNEPLWVPCNGSTHYRLCEVPSCGFQDLTELKLFGGSSGRMLSVKWWCDCVVGVEFIGMEKDFDEPLH